MNTLLLFGLLVFPDLAPEIPYTCPAAEVRPVRCSLSQSYRFNPPSRHGTWLTMHRFPDGQDWFVLMAWSTKDPGVIPPPPAEGATWVPFAGELELTAAQPQRQFTRVSSAVEIEGSFEVWFPNLEARRRSVLYFTVEPDGFDRGVLLFLQSQQSDLHVLHRWPDPAADLVRERLRSSWLPNVWHRVRFSLRAEDLRVWVDDLPAMILAHTGRAKSIAGTLRLELGFAADRPGETFSIGHRYRKLMISTR